MSKVQVDTIVDKDDISAPSLTKGAIVTGVCTATSFDGAISEWVLGANGSSDYTFTGSGLTGAENDPTLYLKRGQKYRFKNSSGGHPFRIQSTANGSTGTAYNDGVTNNDAGNGTTLEWDVQFDAPDVLYYQCTSHGGMGGKIYIGNSGNSSTLVDLNVSGISTFSGDVSIADKIIHTGDTNTAIRFPDADTVSVETSGSEAIRVDSSGRLLIKETSVAGSAPLCVGNGGQELFEFSPGSATYNGGLLEYIHRSDGNTRPDLNMYVAGAGAFKVYTSGANERLRIDSAGKVGIGTTIPTRSFDVRGDATIGIDQHSGNPGTTVGILTVRGHHVNSDSEYAQLYLANSNSSGGSTASIRANRDATSNYATSLSFFTNHTVSAGNGDERLRIGTTGQLGLSAGGVGVAATDYGTSGQVLTSGGASATATWADASSPGGATGLDFNDDVKVRWGTDNDLEQYHDNSNAYVVNTGGQLLIRSTTGVQLGSPSGAVYFSGTENGQSAMYFNNSAKLKATTTGLEFIGISNGSGNAYVKINSVTGQVLFDSSSRIIKQNIDDSTYGIDAIKLLKPRKFKMIEGSTGIVESGNTELGFIADEMISIIPELVSSGPKSVLTQKDEDTEVIPLNIDYPKLTAVLAKALQEAITKIETLETKVSALEVA
jgi:plastocyanin